MSSNNHISPYYFTQPPPNYGNLGNAAWNYNWSLHTGHSIKDVQDGRNITAPPLPPGPPPPPPPPSTPIPSSHSPVGSTNLEPRSQSYYNNSSSQGAYRNRRYNGGSGQYNTAGQYGASAGQYSSVGGQYSSAPQYSSPSMHYNPNSPGMYSNSQNYNRNFYNKRKLDTDGDSLKKANKKKKKSLSQNIPQRKDWSVDDAKKALALEKEYNKRHRNQSLIIKFPDLELNRDIVSKFHSSIDSVHFQQPCTPRFCFVTLKESADPEKVIKELNKVPFGNGLLMAEYKKDREDEINIGPQDIDPLTLYVGNLAQEITKDDMINTYPKQKRIDIGYAKKMKYTRYAFVSFKNVDDSIEAFRKTHATQMYSKSLIVRFRRLNGTVGMPGEPKPQLAQKNDTSENNRIRVNSTSSDMETEIVTSSRADPWDAVDPSAWQIRRTDLPSVKEEPEDSSDHEDVDNLLSPEQYSSSYSCEDTDLYSPNLNLTGKTKVKQEKEFKEENSTNIYNVLRTVNEKDSSDFTIIAPDKIKKESDSGSVEKNVVEQHATVKIKTELFPVPEEADTRSSLPPVPDQGTTRLQLVPGAFCGAEATRTDEKVEIKIEPLEKDSESFADSDDGDDDSDDNLDDICNIARSKRLKKIKKSIV